MELMDKPPENCICCNGTEHEILYDFGDKKYLRCLSCKLVSVSPLLTDEYLNARANHWSADYHMNPLKINQHFSTDFQLTAYKTNLDLIRPYRKNNRLLDLGCSIGGFLMAAKIDGWQEHGIDISLSVNVAIEKGLNAKQGYLGDFDYPNDYFDVITLFDVIEHINNQEKVLKQIFSLLRPGGILFIITPNFGGITSRILKSKWSAVTPDDHVYLFTQQSLADLLTNNEFEVVKNFTYDINLPEYKNIFRSRSSGDEGRQIDQMNKRKFIQGVVNNGFLQEVRNAVNYIVCHLNIGDRLFVMAKKN